MQTLHKENQGIKIQKEVERTYPLYIATLDSGVKISVFGDYAIGDDGRTYYHIGQEDDEGVLNTLGWSCEVDGSVVDGELIPDSRLYETDSGLVMDCTSEPTDAVSGE